MAERLPEGRPDRPSALREGRKIPLSPRQKQVARMVAEGLTSAQIAYHLGIGVQTVKNHITDIFFRIDARSRVDVANWWRNQEDGVCESVGQPYRVVEVVDALRDIERRVGELSSHLRAIHVTMSERSRESGEG